jgi:uncharacterized 2Fe-2S/4Fe-4S cluster protein (DUF4445 family)
LNYTITVIAEQQSGKVCFMPGPSLRDILNTSELRIRSACRGNGACGLCRVRLVSGPISPPSQVEKMHIEAANLAAGVRLACQLRPDADMTIELLNPARPSNWRSLPDIAYRLAFPLRCHDRNCGRYGVAVDLGTTHISITLRELASGELLASRYGLNPQGRYSSDILSRLQAANEKEVIARELQQLVVEAIGEALMDISVREGRSLYDISRVEVVGNSAMLTLLAGDHYRQLLNPATWTRPISCSTAGSRLWYASWNLERSTQIDLVQPLAGFVGSDLAAGLIHCHLLQCAGPSLFIDFGTNSEIALWDGGQLLVTSAAGGPAFEGMGIACGMAAEAGAIYQLFAREGSLDYKVLGNGEAKGICGSGLIDLAALLLAQNAIDPLGRFSDPLAGRQQLPGTPFWISKPDLDLLQRAKAAIGAGCRALLQRAGVVPEQLQQLLVGGAFGRYLNPQNAMALGLLPTIPAERVELLGNTALAGCQDLLLSDGAWQALADVRRQVKLLNLSTLPEFERLFMENLYLRPQHE